MRTLHFFQKACVKLLGRKLFISPFSIFYYSLIHQNNGSIATAGSFYIMGNGINDNPSGNLFRTGTNGWVNSEGDAQAISI